MSTRETAQPEDAWVEGWNMDRQAELIGRVREHDVREAVAYAMVGWLTALKYDLPNAAMTGDRAKRARYRRILAELGPPTPTRPARRRVSRSADSRAVRRRGQRGAADLRTITVLGVCVAVAALTGHPAALGLTPIILDSPEVGPAERVVAELAELPQAA